MLNTKIVSEVTHLTHRQLLVATRRVAKDLNWVLRCKNRSTGQLEYIELYPHELKVVLCSISPKFSLFFLYHTELVEGEEILKELGAVFPPIVRKRPTDGFVYCLHYEDNTIKIGVTRNLPERLRKLTATTPIPIVSTHTVHTQDMYAIEKIAHNHFESSRTHGEFFHDLDFREVCRFINKQVERGDSTVNFTIL